jgi:REP element-mobilizing transposase RayT
VPRRPRIEAAGAIYHVTARGNAGAAIFDDDLDRLNLLHLLGRVVRDLRWRCFAYCLMGNHYHLLVQTREPNLSKGMHLLQSAYVRRFNKRHDRAGHVFGRRFHDQPVKNHEHLVAAAVYTVLNPVRAGVVDRPEEWRWSSYRATVGSETAPAFLDVDAMLSMLSPSAPRARELFREMAETAARADALRLDA